MSPKTTASKKTGYGASDIHVLKGLEPVRVRPGMYIGSTDARGLHHLVWEVSDNAVDEALAGHCTEISIEIDENQVVTVTDNGRGIPTDEHPTEGISTVEVVFTILHAGGKFSAEGGYKVSGGLHGVGASVVNALSRWLEVEVRRDGHTWHARFERGKTIQPLAKGRKLEKGEKDGTTVSWLFDDEIFTEADIHYAHAVIEENLRMKAALLHGLKFRLKTPGKKEQIFFSKDGLAELLSDMNAERRVAHPDVISFKTDDAQYACYVSEDEVAGAISLDVALQWTDSSKEHIYSFANIVSTPDEGKHVEGMKAALSKAMNNYGRERKKIRKDSEAFKGDDVMAGLSAALSVKIANPQFQGQTKDRLNNAEARSATYSFVYGAFGAWLADKANAKQAEAILGRVVASRDLREAYGKMSQKSRQAATSIFVKSGLPGKLVDCQPDARPIEERELFIVEGDSAKGSAVNARNSAFQAILPIRGKMLNVLGAKDAQIWKKTQKDEPLEIEMILLALGGRKDVAGRRVVATLTSEMRRYGKLIIASVDHDELTFVRDRSGYLKSVRIGEFVDDLIESGCEDGDGHEVLCFGLDSHATQFKPLKKAIRHPIPEPLHRITTAYGRSVAVTSSHSVFVFEDGQVVLKQGNTIAVGDLVVAPRRLPLAAETPVEQIDLVRALHAQPAAQLIWLRGRSVEKITRERTRAAGAEGTLPRFALSAELREEMRAGREASGLTLAQVASSCGFKQAASVSEWETGRGNPSEEALRAYCATVTIDAGSLLERAEPLGSSFDRLWAAAEGSENQRSHQQLRLSDLSESELDKLGDEVVLTSEKYAERPIARYLPVGTELMTLLGFYLAEGTTSRRSGVRLHLGPRDEPVIPELERAFELLFGVKPSRYPGNGAGFELRVVHGVAAAVVGTLFGFAGAHSHTKRIPDIVFNVSPARQLEFLRGWFLGDGSLRKRGLSFNTVSDEASSQLLYLLSAHGVVAGRSVIKPSETPIAGRAVSRQPMNVVTVSSARDARVLEPVWSDHPDAVALEPVQERSPLERGDPTERLSATQIGEILGCSPSSVRAAMGRGDLPFLLAEGKMRRDRTASRADVLAWAARRELRNRHFVEISDDLIALEVLKTEQVEPSSELVYDFSVETDENFICGAGGLCCHNTDADADGAHIRNLLLTMFHELMPHLITEGRVFIALPPLFKIKLDANGTKYEYAWTPEEMSKKLKRLKRTGQDVTRFKGLGEMNADDLERTAFDLETRHVVQVKIGDAAEAQEALNLVMGSSAARRRAWLEDVGLNLGGEEIDVEIDESDLQDEGNDDD